MSGLAPSRAAMSSAHERASTSVAAMVGPPRPGELNEALEQRRAENEERLVADALEAERNAAHRRGEWMTQLPKLHKRGEGMPTQRTFSHTDVTVKQDATWTAAPHNRAAAAAASAAERLNPTSDAPLDMEALAARERDARIGALMDQYHQKHRSQSLVDAHTLKRDQKRKDREERRAKKATDERSSSSSSASSSSRSHKKSRKKRSKKHSSSKKKSKKKRSKKSASSSSSSSSSSLLLSIPSIGPGSFDRDRDLSTTRVTNAGQVQKLVNDARSLSNNFGHGSRRFL